MQIFLSRARGRFRVLPSYLIIGAQKSGTTSLYRYMVQHPDVAPATRKEVHYFDLGFAKGISWYRSFFPSRRRCESHRRNTGKTLITGEATPYYLFHPLAPQRAHEVVPRARLLVLLRDPVDRAFSHYQHEARRGREQLSFRDAVEQERLRLAGERERLLDDPGYRGYNHQRFSYVSRGFYGEQLRAWMSYYPADRFLVLRSEQLLVAPEECLDQVFHFLGLDRCRVKQLFIHNPGEYDAGIDPDTRAYLREVYRPHKKELCKLTGIDFDWK